MGGTSMGEFDLEQMKQVDIRTIDREELVDIRDVKIDETLPQEQRFIEFVRQIKNPYCYKCGKAVVKISFSDTEITLEERLEHYLKSLL